MLRAMYLWASTTPLFLSRTCRWNSSEMGLAVSLLGGPG